MRIPTRPSLPGNGLLSPAFGKRDGVRGGKAAETNSRIRFLPPFPDPLTSGAARSSREA